MNFQTVLIMASVCVVLTTAGVDSTINSIEPKLKMVDSKRYNLLSIERHDALLRKKRSTFSANAQKSPVASGINLEQINNILPVDMGDISQHKGEITKRHACRHLRNRWNHFRSGHEINENREKVEAKESSEESDEVNTEDPSYVASEEIVSKNQEEITTDKPKKAKEDRQRKNKNHDNRNKDKESKKGKSNEDDEEDDKKRKDSDEKADNEEFIFMKAPAVVGDKEKGNRKDNKHQNRRIQRDVIEEESVATTASGYKFTSGYGDFGSKVSFRNINV